MLAAILLQVATLASDPRPISRSWFNYPPAALRNEEQGTVAYEADIGPDGRVTACRIISSSGSALLDSETCQQTTLRGRFHPARDAAGVAVAGTYRGTAGWSLHKN